PYAILDVEAHAIPPRDRTILATHGGNAGFDPAIGSVEAPLPMCKRIGIACAQRMLEVLIHLRKVVRVDHRTENALEARNAGPVLFCNVEAEEVAQTAAEIDRLAIGRHRPDERRRGLDQFAQGALAFTQGVVGLAEHVDIGAGAVPARDAAVPGPRRADREAVPDIVAARPQDAVLII